MEKQKNSDTLQSTSYGASASCEMTQQTPIDAEKKPGMDGKVFKKIFQFSAEAIVLINRDGILVDANDRLCDWLGYTPEEIIGKNFLHLPFLSSDGIEKAKKNFKERILGKQIPAYELDFYTKNGKKITGLIHAVALKNEQGVTYQDLVMVSDITQKKHLRDSLNESEKKYRQLVETLHEGIWAIDKNAITTFVNPRMAEILGYTAEEMMGKHLFSFTDEQGKTIAAENLIRRRQGAKEQHDFEFIRKDGSRVYALLETSPITDETGTYQGAIAGVQDITERKRNDEKLSYQANLLENVSDAIIATDLYYNIQYWNKAAEKQYGWTASEVIGHPLEMFISNDYLGCSLDVILQKISQDGYWNGEVTQNRRDGVRIPILSTLSKVTNAAGQTSGFIAVNRDITERKKVEKEVIESQEKLKQILDSSPDAITVTDLNGNIIECNRATSMIHGFTKAELIGKNALELFSPKDIEKAKENLKKTLELEPAKDVDYTLLTKDGREFPAELSACLIKDASGNPLSFVAITKDITERKRVEEALQKSENRHRASIELTQLLAWTTTGDGAVVEDIPTWRKFTGQSYEAVKGTGWTEAIHPDNLEHTIQTWRKAIETKSVYETEYRIRRFDGVYRDFLARGIPVFKEDGSILEWTGICIDITERKKVEREINYLKKYNENILESNPNPMMVVKGTQIEYVNKSFVSIFGETKNKYIARNLKDVIPSESLPVFENLLQEDGVAKELKFRGKDFIVHSFVIKKAEEEEEEEERKGILFQDITARKRAEDALRIKDWVIESAINAIAISDLQGNLSYVNSAFLKLWGYSSSAEVLGKSATEFWQMGEKAAEVMDALHTRGGWTGELVAHGKNGALFEVQIAASMTLDAAGKPVCMEASFADITERKRAEEELEKSKMRLDVATGASQIGVWELDLINDTSIRNLIHDQIFGYDKKISEWGAKIFFEHIIPEDRPSVQAAFDMAMKTYKLYFECRIVWPNKIIHWITVTGKVIPDSDGKPQKMLGTVIDITERKQAEDALRKSNELFSLFIHHSPIYTYIKEVTPTQSVVLQASDNFRQMIGIPGSEMVGKTMSELFPVELAKKMIADDWAVASTGDVLRIDEDLNGRKYTTIKFPIVQGDKTLLAGYTIDITERKQAEEALRESEEHHRILFASACDALMIIEPPSWKFTSGNQATLEMFKAKNETEFINRGPWDVSPELQPDGRPSAEKAKEMIESAMRNGSQFFEWTHKRMNGEEFFTTVLLSRVKQGGKVFLQATVRDITKQKQLEMQIKGKIDDLEHAKKEISKKNQDIQMNAEHLNMTNQELNIAREQLMSLNQDLEQRVWDRTVEIEKLLKQKDEFIGQLGHDLKTPLTPLNTLLPIIRKREQDPKLIELLDVTIQNVNYMRNLVIKTLQLARLNSPNVFLEMTDFPLSVEIKNVLESMQSTLEETGIIVESNLDDSVIVKADLLQIKELIDNLLTNAMKFTPPGGKITISTVQEQDSVITSIQDTGVGLTVEQLEHLFEEFYKADSSRHDLQSSGLGLAICKRIVEKHGGKIWAESLGPGKGATFSFTMKIVGNKLVKQKQNNFLARKVKKKNENHTYCR